MKVFELLAIHPFSSLEEIDQAHQDAIGKCDPMNQADINCINYAYDEVKQLIVDETGKLDFTQQIKSVDDLVYLLKKFPEHGYQIIGRLDNGVCQFDLTNIWNAFARNAGVMGAVGGARTGIFAGVIAAGARLCREGSMQMERFTPLAKLVFASAGGTNFDTLMTSIEPSLALYLGFRLSYYREFTACAKNFETKKTASIISRFSWDFFAGEQLAFSELPNKLCSPNYYERTRNILAYVTSINKLESSLQQTFEAKNPKALPALTKLFLTLKLIMMFDMQHADVDTLLRNQKFIPTLQLGILQSWRELHDYADPKILDSLEKNLPYACRVHLVNALCLPNKDLALLDQDHEPLLKSLPEGEEISVLTSEKIGDKLEEVDSDDDEMFFDADLLKSLPKWQEISVLTSDKIGDRLEEVDSDDSEINQEDYEIFATNPFQEYCVEILTEVLNFIDTSLENLKKIKALAQNESMVVKTLYFVKIKYALERINNGLDELQTKEESVSDYLERHRQSIQAYCHLLQYVTNIETGQFSACTTSITETIDSKVPIRLTGTKTHENLLDLFQRQHHFFFAENLQTKENFLKHIAHRRSPEWIIDQLGLGMEPKMGINPNLQLSPKKMVKASIGLVAQYLPLDSLFNSSVQQIASEWIIGRIGQCFQAATETVQNIISHNFSKS